MAVLEYRTPPQRRGLPGVLVAVAWVFIAFGLLVAFRIAAAGLNGRFLLDVGILGIFIGRGLLRRSPGWRTCALALLWIEMILCVLFLIIVFAWPVFVFSAREGAIFFPLVAGGLGISIWQYWVLTRPEIRAIFLAHPHASFHPTTEDAAGRLEEMTAPSTNSPGDQSP